MSEVRDRGEAVERLLNDLSFRLGLDQGEAATIDRTAVKGFDFEDVVYATIESIAAPLQDVPSQVGNELGASASKIGDIVVDIDPSFAKGDARFVGRGQGPVAAAEEGARRARPRDREP